MDTTWPLMFVCGIAGVLLGVFFFGSLWWVVRRLPEMSRPGLWVPLSSLLRTLVVLGGVYLLMGTHWERLVAVLLGFVIGRFLVFRQLGISQHGSSSA